MSSVSYEFKEKSHIQGFVIVTGDEGLEFLMPRLIDPEKTNTYKGYGKIAPENCLFIFASKIIYKFYCEDFDVSNFDETRKYLSAHYSIDQFKKKPWFPNSIEKKLMKDRSQFIIDMYFQLVNDLEKYDTYASKEIVAEAIKELNKLKLVL